MTTFLLSLSNPLPPWNTLLGPSQVFFPDIDIGPKPTASFGNSVPMKNISFKCVCVLGGSAGQEDKLAGSPAAWSPGMGKSLDEE